MFSGITNNGKAHCDLLKNRLKPTSSLNRRGFAHFWFFFLKHDSERPHTARATSQQMLNLSLECLPHSISPHEIIMCLGPLRRHHVGRSPVRTKRLKRPGIVCYKVNQKIFFFPLGNSGIGEMMADTKCSGGYVQNDKEFSIQFVHFIRRKKERLKLLYDSPLYTTVRIKW